MKKLWPTTNWMVLIAVIAAIFALSPMLSKGSVPETLEFNGDTGTVTYGARICKADTITRDAIALLVEWSSLVHKLERFQQDGIIRMTTEEAERGHYLDRSGTCVSVASYYNIIIKEEVNQYVLFQFDPQYGFGNQSYILNRSGFQADMGIL